MKLYAIINILLLATQVDAYPQYDLSSSIQNSRRSSNSNSHDFSASKTPSESPIYYTASRVHLAVDDSTASEVTVHITNTITSMLLKNTASHITIYSTRTTMVTVTLHPSSTSAVQVHITRTVTKVVGESTSIPTSSHGQTPSTVTIHITKTSTSTVWLTTVLANDQYQSHNRTLSYSNGSILFGNSSTTSATRPSASIRPSMTTSTLPLTMISKGTALTSAVQSSSVW
ncbi:hypothetical protein EG329_003339 [Mollisiaceae sp. DMI_Dod_QoI]|nr:hypothetical protein EG329_003339 [Helotiales sp. DMI_Dod_QoI]